MKTEKIDSIRKVTWVGLVVNVGLTVVKITAGTAGSSQALVADGFHSLSDLISDFLILFGVKVWSQPGDDDHPHGHRRFENLITICLGMLLLMVGGPIIIQALIKLQQQHVQSSPAGFTLVIVAVAIAVKEILYHYTMRVGVRIKSEAVVANAWHHRSDAISSLPVIIALIVAILRPRWGFIDHIGALVVGAIIIHVGMKIIFNAVNKLLDRAASKEDRDAICAVANSVSGVKNCHALRTRYLGEALAIDLHLEVSGDLTVQEGHDIAERVKKMILRDGPNVVDAIIHIEPEGDRGD